MQLLALESIARHRKEGVLRSELFKKFDMDAKGFHYVATVSTLHLPAESRAICAMPGCLHDVLIHRLMSLLAYPA